MQLNGQRAGLSLSPSLLHLLGNFRETLWGEEYKPRNQLYSASFTFSLKQRMSTMSLTLKWLVSRPPRLYTTHVAVDRLIFSPSIGGLGFLVDLNAKILMDWHFQRWARFLGN